MLTLKQVCKTFGTSTILQNISFRIKPSETIGLAGPSGSGKSTLLRCIQHLDNLDSGSIQFEGTSGFMFQDFQLFPHMTVLQNLIYAPSLKDKNRQHQLEAFKLLHCLGISDKANAFPHQLSGGQKQRVAFARSLMMKPSLLLCDEPTSGLDLSAIDEVITLLNSVKESAVSMIIASHDLNFLTKISDRLLILKQGQLVADVKPQTLINPVQALKHYYQENL
ncbi:amino acid ABC transporter ATP-binding protein [Legionella jamestowniensis]|uniref:ABC transporter ATP-binding protein n=1 Tax=Legionella jamestowniensis TaxID=455 RepID=A0A0W0UJJ7_9GAMM|nr:ATP-binding cassette domain-containing protein [Legionella jamestowniensis]KTD08052.1 ABC transporter ATP-binding protein [Legionella jamestowniensis]OCH97333.1 amino acid ABC transporter ATP-binding protein [Legionella jamestowniensis]SFM05962.1 polar amino acid transport system ATP-binding protein [Legionella jamestowniensis DSM 19215]